MSDCSSIDPFVTPYVDEELAAGDRQAVDQHLQACPPCRARIAVEQAIRRVMRTTQTALRSNPAPEALRAKCAALSLIGSKGSSGSVAKAFGTSRTARTFRTPRTFRTAVAPLALAATLVLVVAGAFLYQLTARSTKVMAAELAADHVKCFLLHRAGAASESKAMVEQSLAAKFQWGARLPDQAEQAGLELIGERTCLYGQGRVAHIMYRHEGRPVSVFMLPNAVRDAEVVDMLGHGAAVWSVGGRTFVLVGRETRTELERMASFVRAGMQ